MEQASALQDELQLEAASGLFQPDPTGSRGRVQSGTGHPAARHGFRRKNRGYHRAGHLVPRLDTNDGA